MNENKKLYIVLIIIAVFALIMGGLVYKNYMKEQKIYQDFVEKFNGSEATLFYIGRPTCTYCNLLNYSLDEMKTRYNFDDYYINIDEISSGTLQKIISHFNLTDIGTPYLAVAANGQIKDVQNGFVDYDKLFAFLQKNGIIDSTAELALNYIDFNTYKTKLAENKLNVFVIGQSLCQYCAAAKIQLNKLVDDKNVEINYVNITYLQESGEITAFNSSLDYFQEGYGTPVMIVTKAGKIVDTLEGYTTLGNYVEFLEKNGVL